MPTAYRLHLLGEGVRLFRHGELVRLDARAGLLLALLALAGPTTRERAAGLLWPDGDDARARGNLRQTLMRLRRVADVVGGDPLRLAQCVDVDVARILDGDAPDGEPVLLGGVDASFSAPLEEWLDAERTRVSETVQACLTERAASERAAGRFDLAIAATRRSLAFEPLSEASYRTLMDLQLEQGDARGALATFGRCRGMLARHYDAAPARSTVELAERAAAIVAERARAGPLGLLARGAPVDDPAALARRAESGGWLREGAALLRVAASETPPGHALGTVLVNLAWLEHQLGNASAASVAAEEGVALLRRGADRGRLVDGLFVLGSLARHRGDAEEARSRWREALAGLGDGLGTEADTAGRARLHLNLALVEDALNDPAAARAHYLAAVSAAEDAGDDRALATALNNLGHDRLGVGRLAEARTLLRRSMALARAVDDRQLEGHVLDGLARLEALDGDAVQARALASRAVELARELGDRALQAEALATLASCWRALGDDGAATTVAGAALREAWDQGYLPGVANALLELAEAYGAADPRTRLILSALVSDPRVGAASRDRALVAAGGHDGIDAAPSLDDAVAVTLG